MIALAKKNSNSDLRRRDADRKRAERAATRIVLIPKCANRRRRNRLEKDIYAWLRWYGHDEFTREFTEVQKEMIQAILNALKNGGDQSIAAPRGEGKSSVAEWVLIFCVLTGLVKFGILFAATGSDAENSLDAIRERIEDNERLADDYPEVCIPVRALENTPQRAGTQLVSGERHDNRRKFEAIPSRFSWCGREIKFPRVPGSRAAGAIIATRGLDAAVRGMKRVSQRPEIAIIDDPDTDETVNSEEQAAKLEKKIDRSIAGLSGQSRRLSRVILTTLQRRQCVSAKYTDPEKKPSFRGRRFKFLINQPERIDLWEEYVSLRHGDLQNETSHAHDFYVANRGLMDAGAIVSNEHRRGDAGELSALQFYFNEVARIGQEAVDTEYQNDPPEETGPIESGITAYRIQRQVSGYERGVIPPGCTVLTRGIDVRKVALHWVVRAWMPNGTGFTIDYGVHEVLGTTYGSDDGLDVAIRRAILAHLDEVREFDGKSIDLTLVDAGWQTTAVYSACAEAGLGVMPVMGFGKSAGCAQANFSEIQRRTMDKRPGDGWFLSRKGSLWLVCADTDRWKQWEHDRWMTAPGKPGVMTVFGEGSQGDRLSADEKGHHSYARHITNEVEIEEPHKGTIRRRWKAKSENTHWLDASYYADVAANMKGVKILSTTPETREKSAIKLSELYKAKHGARR